MKSEFRVLPWLRDVRDRYAEETEGLDAAERIDLLRRETEVWVQQFLRHHPQKPAPAKAPALIRESPGEYPSTRQRRCPKRG
jgi:hypothetical protein